MTLANTLLQKLSEWRPHNAAAQPDTLTVADEAGVWSAAVTAAAVDVVGARLWDITFRRANTTLDADALKTWGGQVAARVTGLLEPLRLLEVDEQNKIALLRSDKPGQRGDVVLYYEVRLTGDGAATVQRFQASHQPETKRQQVEFTLTHEALAKLSDDVTF
jgi:hypothetical protein